MAAATDPLAGRIAGGAVLQIGGAVAAVLSEDLALSVAAWVVAGFGSVLVLIGVIGWGVLAGLQIGRAHV